MGEDQIIAKIAEILSENESATDSTPMWLLLFFVIIRWVWQEKTNRDGPHFIKNGAGKQFSSQLAEKIGKKVADELGTRLVGPLQRQASALEEVARELLDSRICPFRPADAEKVAEQTRAKQVKLKKLKEDSLNPDLE